MLRGTLLVMAAMAVGLAAPGLSVAQTPAQDSVTGFAVDCQFPDPCPPDLATAGLLTRLTANARSGPSGEVPAGTMTNDERVVGAGIHDETQVTCLSVSDHVAVIGVTGTRSITLTVGTISVSVAGLIRVSDGGGPDSGLDTYELALEQGPLVPPPPPPPLPGPTDCSAFPGGELFHNERGDLVVTDAPPAPTSKDQCKNGGWRTYGVFNNQGACVRFVRRRAREACIFERVAHGTPAFRAKYGIGPEHERAMWSCVHTRIGF